MTTKSLALDHRIRAPSAELRGAVFGLRIASTTIAGAPTTYIDEGSGPPVVLLHGAPVTSLGFVRVIRELQSTHRVIAPDFPGFGGSEVPAGFGGTLGEYATFVVDFCQKLGLVGVVLYVNDASGCIGIPAAARLPRGTVKGLVVASTVPIPLTGAAAFVRFILRYVVTSRVMRWLNRRFNVLPWLVANVAPLLRPFSKAERQALEREFDTPPKRDRLLDLFEQMAVDQAFLHSAAQAAKQQLSQVPALILYGQLDPMRMIGGVTRFRGLFPRSDVVIVPWEEHFPILSSGTQVGRAVRDWMRQLPEAPP